MRTPSLPRRQLPCGQRCSWPRRAIDFILWPARVGRSGLVPFVATEGLTICGCVRRIRRRLFKLEWQGWPTIVFCSCFCLEICLVRYLRCCERDNAAPGNLPSYLRIRHGGRLAEAVSGDTGGSYRRG